MEMVASSLLPSCFTSSLDNIPKLTSAFAFPWYESATKFAASLKDVFCPAATSAIVPSMLKALEALIPFSVRTCKASLASPPEKVDILVIDDVKSLMSSLAPDADSP